MHSKFIRPFGFIVALAFPLGAMAQLAAGPASIVVTHANVVNSAVASAKAGDFATAETMLFSDNVQRPNTFDWDIEATTKLVHLAFTLRQTLDYPNSNIVVQQALARLIDTSARHVSDTPAVSRAHAYESAGFIYETLLFDPVSAKVAYLQALSLNSSSKVASAGLARIQAGEQVKTRVLGGHD
jgi:hypothetical protein